MEPFSPKRHAFITFLSLFTSAGTLICCALPALFVSLGMGAVFAGVVANIPALIYLSEHKIAVFGIAAIMLVIAGGAIYHARNLPCPIDPVQAKTCARARVWSKRIYYVSVALFTLGAFFAFLAPKIFG